MRYIIILFTILLSSGAAQAAEFVFINNNPATTAQSEHFVSSTPAANQALDASPDSVVITFSSPLRSDKSSIKVLDMYGTQQNDGGTTVSGVAMSTVLPSLPSGKYAVKWRARCMCDDNSELSDEFHFTVK